MACAVQVRRPGHIVWEVRLHRTVGSDGIADIGAVGLLDFVRNLPELAIGGKLVELAAGRKVDSLAAVVVEILTELVGIRQSVVVGSHLAVAAAEGRNQRVVGIHENWVELVGRQDSQGSLAELGS